MTQFNNPTVLKKWLLEKGIDISSWDKGEAKSVENLWDEVTSGEITLRDNPPLRVVQVVQVIIRRGNQLLIEAEQELRNGQRRSRKMPPSEKMKPGESYIETAQRCLQEELGLETHKTKFAHSTYRTTQTIKDSPSYPGLPTQYTFHTIEATINELPDGDFWRDNMAAEESDPVKRHRWTWKAAAELGNADFA